MLYYTREKSKGNYCMEYKDVCVIAGANSEIAIGIAMKLKSSHRLLLCWHKNHNRIDQFLMTSQSATFHGDLRYESQCEKLYEYCVEKYGRIDVLINCIGKNDYNDVVTEEIWDDVLGSNLKPTFFLSKHFLEYLTLNPECNKIGCLINIASTAGINPLPSSPHYVASKAGIIALTKYYSKVMAPYATVNSIAPGYIETEKHKLSKYQSVNNLIPMKRMANIQEIADTVQYLINAKYLTGQTIVLDGGLIG